MYSARVVSSERGHRVLRVTRSNGSGGSRPSTSGAAGTGDFDYDFIDVSVDGPVAATPSLSRFPSFKRASIFRAK